MVEQAGRTVGVEEEYHLVDADSGELLSRPELCDDIIAGRGERHLRAEMLASQLEAVTDVCTDLDELRTALLDARRAAVTAAAGHGAAILGTSTHPFAPLAQAQVVGRPRYEVLRARFGAVVSQLNLTGCHVHVGVADPDEAVAIMNHARPYLPVLAALTASSPLHEGADTGFASFRLAQLSLWPQGGLPPVLESAAHYRAVVSQLIDMGMVDEPSMVLWELRPSERYPTLEFRIADMCPEADDAVLFAGVVRALVRVLAQQVQAGVAAVPFDDAVLRAARWRAARFGLSGDLWSARQRSLVPAAVAVEELWQVLAADLDAHAEADVLRPLLDRLLARGPSATRQRRILAETGSMQAVVRDGIDVTTCGVTSGAPTEARTATSPPRP